MELEMSRFKQFLIEAVGSATFGGAIKSSEMTKIGRRLAKYSIDFNASNFKKMPAKSFRFSNTRMMFTKFANEDKDSSTQREMTIVAVNKQNDEVLVMTAYGKSDYRIIYCNQEGLGDFAERTYKSARNNIESEVVNHRKIPAVVECGVMIERIFNSDDTIVYVAVHDVADRQQLGDKRSAREAAKSGEDKLEKLNLKIKRRVNVVNSVAFKKLSAVAKQAGYRVDNLVKERFSYGSGKEYVYLNASISRASDEDYLPSIYIERDKTEQKLVATVQTTSWGSMTVDKLEKAIEGYQKALKVAKAINDVSIEEVADTLSSKK